MGSFIANTIQYRHEEDKIYIKGGSSNIVPRYNEWTFYHEKRHFLLDLISGCLKLYSKNKLATDSFAALKEIEDMHKKQFGNRQNNFQSSMPISINPYSLYQISRYKKQDKEEILKNLFDTSHISKEYIASRIEEAEATKQIFDEASMFYEKAEKHFFSRIGIAIEEKNVKESLTQLSLF